MNKNNAPTRLKPYKRKHNYGKYHYTSFLTITLMMSFSQPVYATNMWTKANEIMKDVYVTGKLKWTFFGQQKSLLLEQKPPCVYF